jgi:hypothetical protein
MILRVALVGSSYLLPVIAAKEVSQSWVDLVKRNEKQTFSIRPGFQELFEVVTTSQSLRLAGRGEEMLLYFFDMPRADEMAPI